MIPLLDYSKAQVWDSLVLVSAYFCLLSDELKLDANILKEDMIVQTRRRPSSLGPLTVAL